jgi:hypothetical protein
MKSWPLEQEYGNGRPEGSPGQTDCSVLGRANTRTARPYAGFRPEHGTERSPEQGRGSAHSSKRGLWSGAFLVRSSMGEKSVCEASPPTRQADSRSGAVPPPGDWSDVPGACSRLHRQLGVPPTRRCGTRRLRHPQTARLNTPPDASPFPQLTTGMVWRALRTPGCGQGGEPWGARRAGQQCRAGAGLGHRSWPRVPGCRGVTGETRGLPRRPRGRWRTTVSRPPRFPRYSADAACTPPGFERWT